MASQHTPGSVYDLSIVMPARDEAARLPQTLMRLRQWCRAQPLQVEVVIADDGSRDDTRAIAAAASRQLPIQIVRLGQRAGAGAAVRAGVLAARGRRILVCDADGPVPFAEIERLWRALDDGYDLAAGSRRLRPDWVESPQPWHRVLMGRAWRRLVRQLAPTAVQDTQCGFKLFTRAAALAIFSRLQSRGFVFHVEALALAEALGLAVVELPVRWRDVRGSRVHLLREPWHMLLELVDLAARRRAPLSATPNPPTTRQTEQTDDDLDPSLVQSRRPR